MAAAMPGGGTGMASPIRAPRDFTTYHSEACMPPKLQIPALYTPHASPNNADSSDGHNYSHVSPGRSGYFVSEFGVTGDASPVARSPPSNIRGGGEGRGRAVAHETCECRLALTPWDTPLPALPHYTRHLGGIRRRRPPPGVSWST